MPRRLVKVYPCEPIQAGGKGGKEGGGIDGHATASGAVVLHSVRGCSVFTTGVVCLRSQTSVYSEPAHGSVRVDHS